MGPIHLSNGISCQVDTQKSVDESRGYLVERWVFRPSCFTIAPYFCEKVFFFFILALRLRIGCKKWFNLYESKFIDRRVE